LTSSPSALPASEVQDDFGSGHGGLDPLAGGQVAGHQLDALPALLSPSAPR